MLEKTFESPLDYREIKSVNPEGNQPWMLIGRTDAEAQYFAHLMKSWHTGKEPDARKDWEQEKVGTENEMIR